MRIKSETIQFGFSLEVAQGRYISSKRSAMVELEEGETLDQVVMRDRIMKLLKEDFAYLKSNIIGS